MQKKRRLSDCADAQAGFNSIIHSHAMPIWLLLEFNYFRVYGVRSDYFVENETIPNAMEGFRSNHIGPCTFIHLCAFSIVT